MDYEKEYKEALERAKKWYNAPNVDKIPTYANRVIEEIFPELKESEDEKVRKALIEYFNEQCDMSDWNGVYGYQVVAWLEKQGAEMKTIGESLGFTTQEECDEYNQVVSDLIMSDNDKGEQKQKSVGEEIVEALRTEYEKGRADAFAQMQQGWSEEDECTLNGILDDYKSMCKTYRNWLESIKNRIQPQQKQEWSEEDENGLGDAIWCCKQAASIAKDENDMGNVWYAEHWLKSIKERYTWRPSDEQMRALEYIINNAHNTSYSCKIAKELLEQLRKLKGEEV